MTTASQLDYALLTQAGQFGVGAAEQPTIDLPVVRPDSRTVGTILEGSVRTADHQVRITAQLIEVPNQTHLWSMEYDRAFQDIFPIQRDIATRVAKALQGELLGVEKDQLEKQGTANLEAYTLYLKGLYHHRRLPQSTCPGEEGAGARRLTCRRLHPLACGKMLYFYDWGGAEWALTRAHALQPNSTKVERAQHEPISRVYCGGIHMGLDGLGQAFVEYDKAYEERNHNLALIKASMYDNRRADPRYRALLQKMSLPPD